MSRFLCAVIVSAFVAGCGTTSVSQKLVEKPASVPATVRVVFVGSDLSFQRTFGTSTRSTGQSILNALGFYEVGDKVVRLAPPALKRVKS